MADCIPVCCDSSCLQFVHCGGGTITACSTGDEIIVPGPPCAGPCEDLGGPPSPCTISDGLDNLFHSIGPKLSRRGHEDYRCFYIWNKHPVATLRNVIIFLDGTGRQVPGKRSGTYVAIGVKLQDEIQKVVVTGPAPPRMGEYMELVVPCYSPPFKVFYDWNLDRWIGNFQTAIRAVEGLPEVVVTGEGKIGTSIDDPAVNVTFTINYGGHVSRNKGHKGMNDHARWMQAARHQIKLIRVTKNTMLNNLAIPMPVQDGSPVNTIAEVIPDEITPPSGIVFDYYFRGNPIRIGDLRPLEFLPIWVRRTLPIVDPYYGALARNGQMSKLLDEFEIVVDATSP
jgi:hypothetical protein